jgi:hypothetical protein
VPEADEDLANAGVNAVEMQQGRNQSSEDFTTDCASEGKQRSIFPISELMQLCIWMLVHLRSGVELKP